MGRRPSDGPAAALSLRLAPAAIRSALIAFAACFVLVPARGHGASLGPVGAAACTGCHPRHGGELPRLAGHDAAEIIAAMQAFRAGTRPATVMDRIAKGFSAEEIAAIASWYAAQQ